MKLFHTLGAVRISPKLSRFSPKMTYVKPEHFVLGGISPGLSIIYDILIRLGHCGLTQFASTKTTFLKRIFRFLVWPISSALQSVS
jgi:hypothetical protein